MKKKSILVLSATAGAGHVRAAEALVEASHLLSLPITIQHIDVLDYTSRPFKKLYSETYTLIVNNSPKLWGYLYKTTESKSLDRKKSFLMKLFDSFNYQKFLQALNDHQPDAALCTHFLPYWGISHKMSKPEWRIPFFAVPTDYGIHSLWMNPWLKRYYVATAEAAWTIKSRGFSDEKILVTGIPVMPQFGLSVDQHVAREEFSLDPHTLTIMVLSGGYGVGVLDELVPSVALFLSKFERKEFQLLVVCGRNRKLYNKLNAMNFPSNVKVYLYQFVPYIDKLMDCADVLITKAGGLTVSEALAKNLPMIIYDPFPGQEGLNATYIIERGAALGAINFSLLNYKLKQLIEEPRLLEHMKANAKKIARPNAAKEILADVLRNI
ncbi:MAG: glycosyltransferase [Ignavibacteriae bacterium]|nr:glycosyltransferase [Ignavibacteriota bacterium]